MIKQIIIVLVVLLLISAIGFCVYKFIQKNNKPMDHVKILDGYNCNARIDISNTGKDSNDVIILEKTPSDMKEITSGNHQDKQIPGNFKSLLFIAKSEWQKGEIKFKSKGDGYIDITFMGHFDPDENGNAKKIFVDYKNASVNGETIFTDTKTLWHDQREHKTVQAIDGETYILKFEFKLPDEK